MGSDRKIVSQDSPHDRLGWRVLRTVSTVREETRGYRRMAVGWLVILLAISGVLILGGVQAWIDAHWPTATGTVVSCQPIVTYRPRSGIQIVSQTCQVSWEQGGASHQGKIDLALSFHSGDRVLLNVHGDSLVTRKGNQLGYVIGAFGIAMFVFLLTAFVLGLVHRHRVIARTGRPVHHAEHPPGRPKTQHRPRNSVASRE